MIVSVNPKPSLKEFSDLMMRTDKLLNEDAIKRPIKGQYYASTDNIGEGIQRVLQNIAKIRITGSFR